MHVNASASQSLVMHWPEYAIEAAGLGLFMIAACTVVALLDYPGSIVASHVGDAGLRRALVGVAMGVTAIALIYSPWGKRSGAHLNPAVTLTFYRLRKVERWDAVFYVLAQFAGAAIGVALATALLGHRVASHSSVRYVVTVPGPAGEVAALAAEALIAFGLMLAVLTLSNRHAFNRYTCVVAGALVALYITFEAPISGMSMNPARTFGSALSANTWTSIWIYFVAPLAGMLAAAEVYVRLNGEQAVLCCKLHHENGERCIFRCRYRDVAPIGSAELSNG
jgi:aquaporin Z